MTFPNSHAIQEFGNYANRLWDNHPRMVVGAEDWRKLRGVMEHLPGNYYDRVAAVSNVFVGTPFSTNATGDGRMSIDRRFAVRLDCFDCHTLVETTLSVAASSTPELAVRCLRWLRYRGGLVDRSTRHQDLHSGFVADNLHAGNFENISPEVWSEAISYARALTDHKEPSGLAVAPAELIWSGSEERGTGSYLRFQPYSDSSDNDYLILSHLLKCLPSGIIGVFVRNKAIDIGLIIQTPRGCVFRHAVKTANRVRDERLEYYLQLLTGLSILQGLLLLDLNQKALSQNT